MHYVCIYVYTVCINYCVPFSNILWNRTSQESKDPYVVARVEMTKRMAGQIFASKLHAHVGYCLIVFLYLCAFLHAEAVPAVADEHFFAWLPGKNSKSSCSENRSD
jgi:hypothetical protein